MDYREWVAEDFLEYVWGDQEGWVDIPAKVGQYWVPFSFEWPADSVVTQRIESSLRDHEDLYYSVCKFKSKGRAIGDTLPNHWLWADLDNVNPAAASELGIPPTVAVESSPGRYQALWRLHHEIRPTSLEKLNRALSYALDADKGGWDLTQVLRIPGTRNFKYEGGPLVKLLFVEDGVRHDPKLLWARLREMLPGDELREATSVVIPRTGIGARAKALLRAKADEVVPGERSARLWELECLLAESGLGEDEIFDLVWQSAWNKWRATGTGRTRLVKEVRKAIEHVKRKKALAPEPRKEPLAAEGSQPPGAVVREELGPRFVAYPSFMAMRMREPKWLIQDIWAADAHGIIGGEPKTAKTTIGLALALAVASGKPFLGKWPVHQQGPALFVQEENSPQLIQDRLRKMAQLSGLLGEVETRRPELGDMADEGKVVISMRMPEDVPMKLMNNAGLDLSNEEHRDLIWKEVEEYRPKVLVIDPLYLVLNADADSAHIMRPFLQWLLDLRFAFDCAVILVHHMRKHDPAKKVRAGQNLLGSTTLHAWVSSAIYMSHRTALMENWSSFTMEREFRSMPPQKPIRLDLWMGDPGTLDMEVNTEEYAGRGAIEKLAIAAGDEGLRISAGLMEETGLSKAALERIAVKSPILTWVPGRSGRGNTARILAETNGSQAS